MRSKKSSKLETAADYIIIYYVASDIGWKKTKEMAVSGEISSAYFNELKEVRSDVERLGKRAFLESHFTQSFVKELLLDIQ